MDSALHRLEVLPGTGRYAVTFRAADGVEQTATVRVDQPAADGIGRAEPDIDVTEASLPAGWRRDCAAFAMLVGAVHAVDAASRFAPPALGLTDVDGGWDVTLGNVLLGADDLPTCIAHGALATDGSALWSCPDCGARARLRR